MKRKILCLLLSLALLCSLLPIPAAFAAQTITSIEVNFPAPVAGASPSYTPTFLTNAPYYNSDYTHGGWTNNVMWVDEETQIPLTAGTSVFAEGKVYSVTVYLTPNDGYAFAENDADITATINGQPEKTIYRLGKQIGIKYVFPATKAAQPINRVDIGDITLPVAGEKPDLSATLGNTYDTHKITLVEWSEYDEDWEWQKDMNANDTFKEGFWYVVYVHLETTSGNTFDNSVIGTINNETAHISGNSVQANGTKVCFYTSYQASKPLTAIDKVDLTVVKPVVGKTPTFAKVDTTQYFSEKYGTVSNCFNGVTWTNQSSGVNITVNNPFKADTEYKVTYYLTAKDGYEFTTFTVCTINGTAAAIELTDHYHAKVSLIIPATASTPTECDGGESCPSGKFVDINVKAWYHLYVDYAVTNGLFGGTSANTFEPETAMTRAMLVTVLWRYEGQPKGYQNTFTDVNAKDGSWYIDAVAWAAANGIVNGVGNNRFDPDGKITREQMAAILFRYAQKKGIDTSKRGELSNFPDANKISAYAKEAVSWAVGEGIINGSDGKLLPQGNATRAQVATILMRYIENIVKK